MQNLVDAGPNARLRHGAPLRSDCMTSSCSVNRVTIVVERDGGEFVPIVLGNMTNDRQTNSKLSANHPEHLEDPKFQREQRDWQPQAYRPAFHPLEVGLPNPEL